MIENRNYILADFADYADLEMSSVKICGKFKTKKHREFPDAFIIYFKIDY